MPELGIEKRVLEEAKNVYRKGMTKGEFTNGMLPNVELKDAPPWAHWVLDKLWDIVAGT